MEKDNPLDFLEPLGSTNKNDNEVIPEPIEAWEYDELVDTGDLEDNATIQKEELNE